MEPAPTQVADGVEDKGDGVGDVAVKEEPKIAAAPEPPVPGVSSAAVNAARAALASDAAEQQAAVKDVASDVAPAVNVLPFLACVADTAKLSRAKTVVTADRWAANSWQLIIDWAARDTATPVAPKRALYRGMLEVFPTSGRLWRDLVELEMARGKRELVEEYFTRSLMLCQHVPLWLAYLAFIRSKPHVTPIGAREEAITAYEFAVAHIGVDPESAPVWESYVEYLRALPAANQFEESDRMGTIRRVYQRAITMPLEGLETIWRAYQAWEHANDPRLAPELTQKFASVFTDARVACRERSGYTKGIRRGGSVLAVPPNDGSDTLHQVLLWKRLILFEKVGAAADAAFHLKRVRFTFDSCLTVLRYYPEIWIDYADTVYKMMRQSAGTKDLAHDAARKVWLQALDALPASPLVHFAFSAFLEAAGALDEAASVFDMMLERDFVSTENKQLALIQQILFVRRTKGMQDARLHSVRAFKSPYASWQLYVAAARMELFVNRDATAARKVFEYGLRTHGKHVPYLVQYITLLYTMNEEANLRVLFDNLMKDAELRGNRELWDEYLRFEVAYGNLVSTESVAARRADALGNAVDPNGLYGTVQRFKVLSLFPVTAGEIRAVSVGANVMLKDGRRGVADASSQRHLLSSSMASSSTPLEKGNPLSVMFRDPEALRSVARPIVSGEGCGLTPFTREMAVGAAMPGQQHAGTVPDPLLELIAALPPAYEFNGPVMPIDDLLALLRAVPLPQEPVAAAPSQGAGDNRTATKRLRPEPPAPGQTLRAPPSADIQRMRQDLIAQRQQFRKQ